MAGPAARHGHPAVGAPRTAAAQTAAPGTGPDESPVVALLAAEAISGVIRRCPTRQTTRTLTRAAAHDPALLEAAVGHCARITALEAAVRAGAIRLLERAAVELRLEQRRQRLIAPGDAHRSAGWPPLDGEGA